MKFLKTTITFILIILISSCANYKLQVKDNPSVHNSAANISHSFYLIGDAGNSPLGEKSDALAAFKTELEKASSNSTAIFLGDNIYPNGLPKKGEEGRTFAEHQLKVQTEIVKNFKGNTIFIPGNHDWYSNGPEGLKRQEKYIEDALGKNSFLPENGCPVDKIHISDDIELIVVDSHWYLTNWDKYPTINDDCIIKTRALFMDEFEDLIKKARGKTTIVAVHHPLYSNGPHGGQYSFGSHMKPLPVLGTIKNVVRKTSGLLNVDLQNKRYNEFKMQLATLAQHNDKVILVSGHEHNMQYLIEDNLHQIISGSGSKVTATRNVGSGQFSYGSSGYARLDIYDDESTKLQFYSVQDKKVVFETTVIKPNTTVTVKNYPDQFPKEKTASIYSPEETEKLGFHKFLWGDRYRDDFSTPVTVPTVNLDTLFGGLKIVRKGGGNQSKSLRLEDKNGTQYVMRAMRKQALQYLQAFAFKNQYIEGQFNDTSTENLILDVFTGSHPYAPFAIATLSDAVGIYHTNPRLYYIPKQNALAQFNDEFGDELYMIEEHTSEGHSDKASFGYQDKLLSTDDMMKKIHKDEDIVVDEASYIRARLFDMLIGDWDRHQDQWRWIEFKENGKKVYRPMPRDRDQAFSIMSDGFLLGAAVKLIPSARLLRKYDDDLVDVKGINIEPFPLDMEFIQQSDRSVWDAQVKTIQNGITDEVIEQAFSMFPKEINKESVNEIKQKLKARRANLQKISDRYYETVNKFAVIKGTDKDDWFDIERQVNGRTTVTAYRIKKGEKADVFHQRTYLHDETKEIWIYALDDDDTFHVYGNGNKEIKVRLIGGQNNDTYNIENGKRITLYDYKSKPNKILTNKGNKKLNDNYETNVYDYLKLKNNTNQIIPTIGFNPDDGFRLGLINTYTNYSFERNPFTSQHTFAASYYFATSGYDLSYKGEFANLFQDINFGIEAQFNSPNFAVNYFGFGNNTPNFEAEDDDGIDVDLDFNRVKIRTFKAKTSLIWRGDLGASLITGLFYETNEVENTQDRFINTYTISNPELFENQDFWGIESGYSFENKDIKAFPTLGFEIALLAGYKSNVDTNKGFGYLIPELAFDYKLVPSGQLVFATKSRAHLNLGDEEDIPFYQAASIGANTGLRGYRNERFTGKDAFIQTTDLRLNLRKIKTGLMPLDIGIYGGFDIGRIWIDDAFITNPFGVLNPDFNANTWNTSFGGGLFFNGADLVTGNLSAFSSDDGLRLAFRLGFGF